MPANRDLTWLNQLSAAEARDELSKCCGAQRWAEAVERGRPYENIDQLITQANEAWWALDASGWLEAFRSHPKIGEKKAAGSVSKQAASWSEQEQQGVQHVQRETSEQLAALNDAYEKKFGFIFIVCATGKSTNEILALLEQRLANEPASELHIAAGEQARITELRLQKLLDHS